MMDLLRRNASFRRVWLGQVLSQGGSKAYVINLLWWVITRPLDGVTPAVASGGLLIAAALPPILLVKPIGRLVSRYPAKTLMVTAEVCGAALIAVVFGLAALDSLPLWLLYVLTALAAVCQGVVDPALTKSVTELVDPADVEAAVAFEASTQSMAFFIGTALGATMTGAIGFQAALVVNIVSYLASAACTAGAVFRAPAAASDAVSVVAPAAGAGAASTEMGVKRLLQAFAAANLFLFPLFLLLPLYVKDVLRLSVVTLGAVARRPACRGHLLLFRGRARIVLRFGIAVVGGRGAGCRWGECRHRQCKGNDALPEGRSGYGERAVLRAVASDGNVGAAARLSRLYSGARCGWCGAGFWVARTRVASRRGVDPNAGEERIVPLNWPMRRLSK